MLCLVGGTDLVSADIIKSNDEIIWGMRNVCDKFYAKKIYVNVAKNGSLIVGNAIGGNANDMLPIASLSKSITGIAIAILIQENKISLDDVLSDILLPSLERRGIFLHKSLGGITVRRLLTHTAGLRPNQSVISDRSINGFDVAKKLGPNADAISYLMASHGDESDGSVLHLYSNISYLLLGLVVEAVSGEGLKNFCWKNIFSPLGIDLPVVNKMDEPFSGFGEWRISGESFLKLWDVFRKKNKSNELLKIKTIDSLFLGNIGHEFENGSRYTCGVYSRSSADFSRYSIWHNGFYSFRVNDETFLSYAALYSSGYSWFFSISPAPKSKESRVEVVNDVRSLLKTSVHGLID